jgi:hypothetical protein
LQSDLVCYDSIQDKEFDSRSGFANGLAMQSKGSKKGKEGKEGKKNFLPSLPFLPFLLPLGRFTMPLAMFLRR